MITTTTTEPTAGTSSDESWAPPGWVHFTGDGVTVSLPGKGSAVLAHGDELYVDAELLDANRDRNGHCALLSRIRDGDRVQPGRWPEGQSRLVPGSLAWLDARENARRAAHAIADEDQRRMALAKFRAEWADLSTSRTLATINPSDDRG